MATEVKRAAEKAPSKSTEEKVVEKTQQFWSKNSKIVSYVLAGIIVLVGGFMAYKSYFKEPAEDAANEAIWTAQSDYKLDSFSRALKGDGTSAHPGFLKVISKHGGTRAANLAKFYAGSCYLHLGDFKNAVKYLEDFSTNEPEVKLRATGLLGDAYSELGNNEKAVDAYKKAAHIFMDDQSNSSEYLYRAAQLYDKMGKTSDAIATFKELKEKFPQSNRVASGEVDKYMARLGDNSVD